MSIIQALRQASASSHKHLETLPLISNLLARRVTLSDYKQLLAVFFSLYGYFEDQLYGRDDLMGFLPDLNQRRKAHLLAYDLASFDKQPYQATPEALPSITSQFQAIGCLYVLEGSTLGGRAMCKIAIDTLGLEDGKGYAFLASYGAKIDERWRDFVRAVNGLDASAANIEAAMRTSVDTFRCFASALDCPERANERERPRQTFGHLC